MSIEMHIGVTLLVTGVAAMAIAAVIDDDRIVKRIFCGSLTAIYAAAVLMIWGG